MSDDNNKIASTSEVEATKPKNRSIRSAEAKIVLLQKRADDLKDALSKIEEARKKKEEALKKLQASAAKPRSTINHQKMLIGAMLMTEMEEHPKLEAQIRARLDAFLRRDRDRAAFGFAPLPKAPGGTTGDGGG